MAISFQSEPSKKKPRAKASRKLKRKGAALSKPERPAPKKPPAPHPIEPQEVASVDAMATAATAEFMRRTSTTFLECCISLCLTHMTIPDVAKLLRDQAAQLEEFG